MDNPEKELSMNWYRKLARLTLQDPSVEVEQLVENGIWLPIVQMKQQLRNQTANRQLQHLFINVENSARRVSDLVKMKNYQAAIQMLQSFEQYLGKVCGYIDCSQVSQNAENVRIMVNDMASRSNQAVPA